MAELLDLVFAGNVLYFIIRLHDENKKLKKRIEELELELRIKERFEKTYPKDKKIDEVGIWGRF